MYEFEGSPATKSDSSTYESDDSGSLREQLRRSGSFEAGQRLLSPLSQESSEEILDAPSPLEQLISRAREDATSIRAEALMAIERREDPIEVSRQLTLAVQDWLQAIVAEGMDLYGRPVPAFTLLGLGSFARGEMAPYSDVDIIFLAAASDCEAVDELAEYLSTHIFNRIGEIAGGFTVDPVTGRGTESPSELVRASNRKDGRDFRPVVDHEGGEALREELHRGYDDRVADEAGTVRAASMFRPMDDGLYSAGQGLIRDQPSFNVKSCLKIVMLLMANVADLARGRGEEPGEGTLERLTKIAHHVPALDRALGDDGLREALSDDFVWLLGLRQSLHRAHGGEHDTLAPDEEQRVRIEAIVARLTSLALMIAPEPEVDTTKAGCNCVVM